MFRILVVLLALGVAAAVLAWYTPEGLTDDLLKITVGLDFVILSFVFMIVGLQWASDHFTRPDNTI